ncbi:hypothetical protein GGI07_002161 [Coemansia sp. Benny D115]|nr:hypothetical protein GGI07_002161 [Coemansia sp. Benny D115]
MATTMLSTTAHASVLHTDSVAAETPRNGALTPKLRAEDIDTFSPLSSSTITIASLGSSLGMQSPQLGLMQGIDSSLKLSSKTGGYGGGYRLGKAPIDDEDDGDDNTSSSSKIDMSPMGVLPTPISKDQQMMSAGSASSLPAQGHSSLYDQHRQHYPHQQQSGRPPLYPLNPMAIQYDYQSSTHELGHSLPQPPTQSGSHSYTNHAHSYPAPAEAVVCTWDNTRTMATSNISSSSSGRSSNAIENAGAGNIDDDGFDDTDGGRNLGIRGLAIHCGTDARKNINSMSYSSGNMSSTASDCSHDSLKGLPTINMRSVSADYTHAYSLRMQNPATGHGKGSDSRLETVQAAESQDLAEANPASFESPDGLAAPLALSAVETIATTDSGTNQTSEGVHRRLTKKLMRPLTWVQPSSSMLDIRSETDTGSAISTPASILPSPESTEKSDKSLLPFAMRKHLQRRSVGAVRQSGAHQLSQVTTSGDTDSLANEDVGQFSETAAAEQRKNAVANKGKTSDSDMPKRRPQPKKQEPNQQAKHIRAAASKSLDISRDATVSRFRGPLSRRAMQRTQGEDAIYGSLKTSANAVGPMRFQALPRSLVSRLGFSNTLASRRQPGCLRFVIAPHPRLVEVIEVIDCEERVPVYRKVSRSGKSWHETFHEVDTDDIDVYGMMEQGFAGASGVNSAATAGAVLSDYEMASALGLPYPGAAFANNSSVYSSSGRTSLRNSASYYNGNPKGSNAIMGAGRAGLAGNAAASCVTFQSSASSSVAGDNSNGNNRRTTVHGIEAASDYGMTPMMAFSNNQSTASFLNAGTVRMARATTSMGMYGGNFGSESASIDKGLLWEALTPYPNQFPLHIKSVRTIDESISLASLVLDRQYFCYRFQLGSSKMRWVAKRARKHQLALQCFVRNTLVAEVFVDYERGYSPYNMPVARTGNNKQMIGHGFAGSNSSSGVSTPIESEGDMRNFVSEDCSTREFPEDGTFPIITILPAAFAQLSTYDSDVVESFIIFTGLQMLECLHV